MSDGFDLRVMGLLLRQGRKLNALSLGLLGLTALWLVLGRSGGVHSLDAAGTVALCLAAAAGVVQVYFAVRVDFDAGLLLALADRCETPSRGHTDTERSEAAVLLDRSLQSLGLVPADKAGRDWSARWRGMLGLLRMQLLCLLLQAAALVAAWVQIPGVAR